MVQLGRSGIATPVLALLLVAAPCAAHADTKPDIGIAAQVGDEAISSVDVDNRMKFIIATAHFSNTPNVIAHIRPQVIRSLVDERLEIQEAAKNDIVVTQQEIDQSVDAIEQQRGMPAGTIFKMLEGDHVPKETFLQQVRAQLSWNRLLMKKIRPFVRASDAEITLALSHMPQETPGAAEPAGAPQEYKIGVVTLPVDKPARENEMRHLGEKLVKEVRGGANFEEVSRQFSSTTASAGGKIETFWIAPSQMEPRLAQSLLAAKAGTVTDAVRTQEGYTIVKVYETRAIKGTKAPQPKVEAPAPAPEEDKAARHERAYTMLIQQKMELEAQKYLRNLRRETFIDIRQ